MKLQSVASQNVQVPNKVIPKPSSPPEALDLQDMMERAAEDKILLETTLAQYSKGKSRCQKAYGITRLMAIGGFTAFGVGAIMASTVPFVAGAAIGSISYVASGFFKGRTQFFKRMISAVMNDLSIASGEYEKLKNKFEAIRDEVTGMVRSLNNDASTEDIVQDDDFVFIDGVKLEKKYRHSGGILHDLFGRLEKDRPSPGQEQ